MPNALLEAGQPRKFGWADTWPVRLAQNALMAFRLPGDVYAGRVDPMSDEGIGRAADLAGLVMGGAYAAAPAMKNASGMGIKAYHGSPHDFDKFDLSKIGTGEGAQAYGHGLYFAEAEPVARQYRDALTYRDQIHKDMDPRSVGGAVYDIAAQSGIVVDGKIPWGPTRGLASRDDIINSFVEGRASPFDLSPAYQRQIVEKLKPPGRMYEVDINAHPDQFLDWDKPLREQPAVGQAIQGIRDSANLRLDKQGDWWGYVNSDGRLIGHAHRNPDVVAARGPFPERESGAMTYGDIAASFSGDSGNKKAATSVLREAGIPGIKYLDQGSRAAGDGSRNYVVFDDSLINILRKYGLAGGAVTGAAAAGASDPAEAKAADQPAPFMSATLKLFGY